MSHLSTYQQGYINGYLEALLAFYNLRYRHANDYRHVEATFIQAKASGELRKDVFNGLAGHYGRSSSFPLEKAVLFSDSLELKPVTIPYHELGRLLEPWLPNEEEQLLARKYEVPADQFPEGERVTGHFLDFVLKEYGLPAGEQRYWEVMFPAALMKTFSYCADDMFTLVIENGKQVNMLHFARKVIYP